MTDRTSVVLLWVVSALFALAHFHVETGIGVDSTQTFGWETSLAWDRDFDFANDQFHTSNEPGHILWWQRQHLDSVFGGPMIAPTGHWANPSPIGPAVIWDVGHAPVMLSEMALKGVDGFAGLDRFAFRYRLILSLVTLAIGIHSLFLIYHTARRFYPPGVSGMAALVAVFGSMATHHILIEGAMTHAPALWAASLMWALTIDRWASPPSHWRGKDLALGMAVGLLVMTRHTAAVWALVPACVYLTQMTRRETRRGALLGSLLAAGGAVFVFSIQMLAWRAVFGQWLTLPQGGDILRTMADGPEVWQTLFGRFQSLFVCHPWTFLALLGFVVWGIRRPALALPGLAALLLTWLLNSAVADWWAGSSFGARRWSHTMPLFALGWAAVMNLIPRRWPRRLLGYPLTAALLLWNAVMMAQHARGLLSPAWWAQRDLWPALFAAAIDEPIDWMMGTHFDFLAMGTLHLTLALAVLLGLLLAFVAIALVTWGGTRPWPRGRWGRALLALAVLHVAVWIIFGLWARIDPVDRERNLELRALLAEGDLDKQWEMIQDGRFTPRGSLNHAVVAGRALDHGRPDLAVAHLASAEADLPRFAHVLTLQRVASPEPRRRAALHLWANLRLLDHHANDALFKHHAREGEINRLHEMVTRLPMTRDQRSDLTLRLASIRGDQSELRYALRDRLESHPSEVGLLMQLVHVEADREREDRAARLHGEARTWAESELSAYEAIAAVHPREAASLFSVPIHRVASELLLTTDVAQETDFARSVIERHRAIQSDAGLSASLDRDLQRRLHESAPRTLGTPQDQALMAAIDAWSGAHLDDPYAHESLIDVWGARGRWEEAVEMLAIGVERVPRQIDTQALAFAATRALSAEAVQTAEIDSLSPAAQPLAALGLSIRAVGLGDEEQAERWLARAREGAPPSWVATVSDEEMVSAIERWSVGHPSDAAACESLVTAWGKRGRWRDAMERLAIGMAHVPEEIDALVLAYLAVEGLDAEEIEEANIDALSDTARPLAAIGLSLRALVVADESEAERWAERARLEGLPPSLVEPLRTRVWGLYGD